MSKAKTPEEKSKVRTCNECKKTLPLESFQKRQYKCKMCMKKIESLNNGNRKHSQEWIERNRTAARERYRKISAANKDQVQVEKVIDKCLAYLSIGHDNRGS